MSAHEHEVAHEGRDYCYGARVSEAEGAAGNIERQQACACGAVRWVAINGRHFAAGPWTTPAFGVIAQTNYGRTHTVASLHSTAAEAWAAIDRDASALGSYVARTSRQGGDTLPTDEMRIVPRQEHA